MNCEHAREIMIDLLYGELDSPAREELLKHIEACPACAAEYDGLRRARSALGRLAANEPQMRPLAKKDEIPATNAGKMPAPQKAARPEKTLRIHPWRRLAMAASAAAAVVLAAMVFLLYDRTLPTVVAQEGPVEIKRIGVSLTILSRPPDWDEYSHIERTKKVMQTEISDPYPNSAVQTAEYSQNKGYINPRAWPGLALVRDQRMIKHIKQEQTQVRFVGVPAGIWPDSVKLQMLDGGEGLKILEQNYEYDLASADAVLTKHIDMPIGLRFKDGKEAKGTLLSFDNDVIVICPSGDGPRTVTRRELSTVSFEKLPQGLLTTPTLIWQLANSGRATQRQFEVDYLTTGLAWRADYVVNLRPAKNVEPGAKGEIIDLADLTGYATVFNGSGVTYENAQIKLMAGDVNLLMRPVEEEIELHKNVIGDVNLPKPVIPQMVEKSFFEYHLYTLTRPTTIADKETKQLEMVSGRDMPMKRGYVYDPEANPTAARVVSEMENSEANGLGKPLPKGVVRLYAPDPEGVQTYVAQTRIDHTPVKEKLRLPWGYAFDIVCDRRETSGRHDGPEHKLTVEYSLRNHKPHDVAVTVIICVPASTYAAKCDLPWHVREVDIIEVPVLVPAGQETKFTFNYSYNNLKGGGLRSPHDQKESESRKTSSQGAKP
ncbi:MAG: zf-HC2 domain-containing protein [Planctomycetes bacterium]|nr:zf-HC2 domain-containing protein [Planctomycetota bacterium]